MPRNESRHGISLQEEQDLRRVFDHMAGFSKRHALNKLLEKKMDMHFKLKELIKTGGTVDKDLSLYSIVRAREEVVNVEHEIRKIKEAIQEVLDCKKKLICLRDFGLSLRHLGARGYTIPELKHIMWEVDENLNEEIEWDEFLGMYKRSMADESGFEPFHMFNIVMFMTLDDKFKGHITEDDALSVLFARYGRDRLEAQMNRLFGQHLKSRGGDGKLNFQEYIKMVNQRIPLSVQRQNIADKISKPDM